MKKRKKRKFIGIIIGLIIVMVLVKAKTKWVKYIDNLNASQWNRKAEWDNCDMGTSKTGEGMSYRVSTTGEYATYNIMYYDIKKYDYTDLGVLWGDETGVDHEFHFYNMDTREEEIYVFKTLESIRIPWKAEFVYQEECFIEDGEKKMFFRYRITTKEDDIYGGYIYNLDAREYEVRYEGDDPYDDKILDMGKRVRAVMGSAPGLIYRMRTHEKRTGYKVSHFYLAFHPGYYINMKASSLPKENERLYSYFPELEAYIGNPNLEYEICIIIPNDMSQEDVYKLFIEDGEEISYEDAFLSEYDTKDGLEHSISSYAELLEYIDEEKCNDRALRHSIWLCYY